MANAANLINFGGSALSVGDWTYSTYPLSAPSYLPLNMPTNRYLIASYPTLASYFGTAGSTVAYSAATATLPSQGWGLIEYGNNVWLAAQQNAGTLQVYRSINNGTTWSSVSGIPAGSGVTAIKYGLGVWIALCGAFYYRSMDDGVTWIKGAFPAAVGSPTKIAFGNNIWLAVGGTVATRSTDNGFSWTALTASPASQSIAYLDGVWLVGGVSIYNTLSSRSLDNGSTWQALVTVVSGKMSISLNGGLYGFNLAAGAGAFVIVGYNFDGTGYYTNNQLYVSTDYGLTWVAKTINAASWSSVTFSNNLFLAVAGNIAPNQPSASGVTTSTEAVSSPDGITWTARVLPSSQRWSAIAGNNQGKFIAVAGDNSYATTVGSVIDFAATTTTFSLPIIAPITGTIPYIKAS